MVDNSTEYFVDTPMTGGVRLNVSSPRAYGTGCMYSGSVNGGSVMVSSSVVTVTGLDYKRTHSISVTASSLQCSGLASTTTRNFTFNIGG